MAPPWRLDADFKIFFFSLSFKHLKYIIDLLSLASFKYATDGWSHFQLKTKKKKERQNLKSQAQPGFWFLFSIRRTKKKAGMASGWCFGIGLTQSHINKWSWRPRHHFHPELPWCVSTVVPAAVQSVYASFERVYACVSPHWIHPFVRFISTPSGAAPPSPTPTKVDH